MNTGDELLQELLTRDASRVQELDLMRQQLAMMVATNERGELLSMVSHPVFLAQGISSLAQRIDAANFVLDDENYLTSYLARDSLVAPTPWGRQPPLLPPTATLAWR